jgi:hypothetical protein
MLEGGFSKIASSVKHYEMYPLITICMVDVSQHSMHVLLIWARRRLEDFERHSVNQSDLQNSIPSGLTAALVTIYSDFSKL